MHNGFIPKSCFADGLPAITAVAGHRVFEIYDAADTNDSVIVGGEDPNVGLGGCLTGGGHYGLAADNILEFEVVTRAGDIVTLNQCSKPDLFFEVRGVIISGFLIRFSADDCANF